MTIEQAKFIRDLKVNKRLDLHNIHIEFQKKYVPSSDWYFSPITKNFDFDRSIPHGNALMGSDLCECALHILNEEKQKWELV